MNQRKVRLNGIKPSSVAMFEGVFGAVIGLAVALAYLIFGTASFSNATGSLLQGLLLGMSVSFFALIIYPVLYFAIGWVLGLVQGYVLDIVLRSSNGLELNVEGEEEPAVAYTPSKSAPAFGERIERPRR